ncbi:MAG: sortase, partial [Aggregatilineales bacterium]
KKRFAMLPLLFIAIIGGVVFYVVDNNTPDEIPAPTATPIIAIAVVNGTPIAVESISVPEQTDVQIVNTADETPRAIETIEDITAQTAVIANTPVQTQPPSVFASYIPENAEIFIPNAGIRTSVVEAFLDGVSWDVSRLGDNAGHLQGTPWVGDGGNAVISGHVERSNGQPGIFANIGELNPGDLIVVMVDGNEWRYTVTEITTALPGDLSPLQQNGSERLTLITCDNYNFIQDSYLDRTVVVAERVS